MTDDKIRRVPLMDAYLVLRDYKSGPESTASGYRFCQSARSLAPEEEVFKHGKLTLVFNAEDDKMPTEVPMGIFLDDLPVFAVQLNKQLEWEMVNLQRNTFQSLCGDRSILLDVVDKEAKPLYRHTGSEPDQLTLFLLGNKNLDAHYPERTSYITTKSLYINLGDPLMLDPKLDESPFTVTTEVHEGVGKSYTVRSDRHLYTLLVKEDDDFLLGGGSWTKGLEPHQFVPALIQLYRITSQASFVPYRLDGQELPLDKMVDCDVYLKTLHDYITNTNAVEEETKPNGENG